MPRKRPVSLKPAPEGWTTRKGRTARPAVERATVRGDVTMARDGSAVPELVEVWRTVRPGALAALPERDRDALEDYGAAVEALAGGGGQDFNSAGGGAPGSRPPSLRRMEAGAAVSAMTAALARRPDTVQLVPGSFDRGRVTLERLAWWAAVDGMTLAAILRAAGAPDGSASRQRLKAGLSLAARRVADHCATDVRPPR